MLNAPIESDVSWSHSRFLYSVVNGFDRDGRPIVWLRPSRENTKPSPTQIRHLIFQLERAIDLCPEGVEKLALVVDYKGATSSNNPSMKTVKEVIYILQNHYVERLGKGVVVNVPFYLQAFFNMIKPLLDPKTKQKVQFNPPLKKLIPSQQLDAEFKGDYQYIYDSNVYLPAICHFCGIKEDGTREEIIPKDIPMSKPDEIQRSLTQNTGNTAEEEAEIARREAEAQERQDREAEKYEETGGEAPVLDGDDDDDDGDVILENGQGQQLGQKDDIEYKNGGKYDAAAVVAAAAAASAAGGAAGATTLHNSKSKDVRGSETSAAPARDTNAPTTAAASTTLGKDSKAEMHPNPTSATANTKPATAQSSAPATAALTKNTKTLSSASQNSTRKRGGWKLFSSKRGLDKEGNPTSHAHKHIIKALCMHKGAISPSKNPSEIQKKVPEKTDTATSDATLAAEPEATTANGAADGRIKIAPEATVGREERTYNNAPLATNATFGPDAYHTAMEAYPTTSDPNLEGSGGGDYFTNLKKIPPVKPSLVDDEHQDKAKLVERPTEIMNRLHEGGTGELTLAFEVKQPPVLAEEEVGQAPTGESAKAAA